MQSDTTALRVAACAERVRHLRDQDGARRADGMAVRDGAAIDVELDGSILSSSRTTSAIAANASLTSKRSTSSTFQPARSSACTDRRQRAQAEQAGLDPGHADTANGEHRLKTVVARHRGFAHDHRGGAGIDPRAHCRP